MLISPDDAEHFLRVYKAAMTRVATLEPKKIKDFISVRSLLYTPKYRKDPPTDDQDLLAALKTAVYGETIIGRHLAKHTEMVGKKDKVYWVKGLTTELREITPPWVWVKTAVMQFKGQWICDGLIESHNILIGSHMMREYTEIIREAKTKLQAEAKAEARKTKTKGGKMPQIKENKVREERITMEIVVDAYDEEERAMGWYYYLEDKLQFPFKAKCVAVRSVSPLEKGDEVEVSAMAPESECQHEMFVEMKWKKRNLAVPLSQLQLMDGDDETKEAMADWHYWVGRGYQF